MNSLCLLVVAANIFLNEQGVVYANPISTRSFAITSTGQTNCTDSVGAIVDCASTRQDAAYNPLKLGEQFFSRRNETVTEIGTQASFGQDASGL